MLPANGFPGICASAKHSADEYNFFMARGWESKSVEEQQSEAVSISSKRRHALSPEQLASERRKQDLLLSRQRVLHQLEAAHNPNHRKMLETALADLNAQLTRLG